VVLVADADGRRLMAHCDPAIPWVWRRDPIYSLLKARARATWGTGVNVIANASNDYGCLLLSKILIWGESIQAHRTGFRNCPTAT